QAAPGREHLGGAQVDREIDGRGRSQGRQEQHDHDERAEERGRDYPVALGPHRSSEDTAAASLLSRPTVDSPADAGGPQVRRVPRRSRLHGGLGVGAGRVDPAALARARLLDLAGGRAGDRRRPSRDRSDPVAPGVPTGYVAALRLRIRTARGLPDRPPDGARGPRERARRAALAAVGRVRRGRVHLLRPRRPGTDDRAGLWVNRRTLDGWLASATRGGTARRIRSRTTCPPPTSWKSSPTTS